MASDIYNKSKKIQKQAEMDAENTKQILLENFFDMKEDNRESMVAEMMLNLYIVNTGKALDEKKKKTAEEIVMKGLYNYNIENDEAERLKKKYPDMFNDKINNIVEHDLEERRFEDLDVILAKEDGKDTIRNLYLEELKKSQAYINVINARSTDELDDALAALEAETIGGLDKITNVKLPNVSEEHNIKNYDDYKAGVDRSIEYLMNDLNTHEWKKDVEEQTLKDLHPKALQKNAAFIDGLYEGIKGVDYLTSSPNFRAMKKELENLKKLADRLAKKKKFVSQREKILYKNQVDKVIKLADVYLENKKDINGPYAENRVKQVRDLRRKLRTNNLAHGELYASIEIEAIDWAYGKRYDNINRYDAIGYVNRNIFLGKYTPKDVLSKPSVFSLGRSAGFSISVFVLLNMGYKAEDILDNQKLHEEKAQVFDDVLRRCTSGTEEDKEWLARQMYEGFKKADAFQDETLKKIDFTKEEIFTDKYYAMMHNMSAVIFDVFQEMNHVLDKVENLYKEDETIPNKTEEEFYYYRRNRHGIINHLSDEITKMRSPYVQIKLDPKSSDGYYEELINHSVKCKFYMDLLKDTQQKGLPYTEASVPLSSVMDNFSVDADRYLGDYYKAYVMTADETSAIADNIMDLSIYKNLKIDLNNKKQIFSNLPMPDDIKLLAADKKFIKSAEKAIKHFENDNFDDAEAVDNYVKDAATIAVYNMYRMTGKHPVDPKTQKPMELEKAARALSGNKVFLKMIRNKDGDLFRHPLEVLKVLKSPEKLVKLANAMEGKKAQGAEVKAKPKAPGHNLPRA